MRDYQTQNNSQSDDESSRVVHGALNLSFSIFMIVFFALGSMYINNNQSTQKAPEVKTFEAKTISDTALSLKKTSMIANIKNNIVLTH